MRLGVSYLDSLQKIVTTKKYLLMLVIDTERLDIYHEIEEPE